MLYHDIHQYLGNTNIECNILIDIMVYKGNKDVTANIIQDNAVNDNPSLSSVIN